MYGIGKLIYRFVVLGVGILIIIMVASAVNLQRRQGINKEYAGMPYEISLANLGSSHGVHAFDYSVYDGVAFNYAMDSQSLEYDHRLLGYYIDHFVKGSVVLIPVSYFSFWSNELDEDSFDAKNTRYFSILDICHMRFRNKKDYYIEKYLSAIRIADRQIKAVFAQTDDTVANPQKTDYTIEEIGQKRAAYHLHDIQLDMGLAEINPDAIDAVISIIKLCQENGITPVLVTTPYMRYYSQWFSDAFLNVFYNEINAIQDEHDVIYIDYSKDKYFLYAEELFRDTDHLNEAGAKVFTKMVVEDLKALGVLKG